MKTLFILALTLISNLALASQWKNIHQNVDGYRIQISYTTASSPDTYGTTGGNHEGIFYFDVFSQYPAHSQVVEIF